jgi:hypothetical protein
MRMAMRILSEILTGMAMRNRQATGIHYQASEKK